MLPITALDLDAWAARLTARAELPVLLRRLVHARTLDLHRVDIPGYDSTNDEGWDGEVQATGSDAFVPDGTSFWELSCKDRKALPGKASEDYDKRTPTTPPEVRAQSTFVFVTARRWPRKAAWRAARLAEGAWKDVQVYDAETLVQWLEQAPAALVWMQGRLGRSTSDLAAPEDLWDEWANVCKTPLPLSIFDEAVEENRGQIESFFRSGERAILDVAADTRSEAAAFAARLMIAGDIAGSAAQRAVVARTPAGLQILKSLDGPLTILALGADVQAQLGGLTGRAKVLVASDKSNPDRAAGAVVEPLTWEAFRRLSEALALSREAQERLDDETGRRISIIRRRLAEVRSVRLPVWADTPALIRPLLALALAGGWYWDNPGDRRVLSEFSGRTDEEMEVAIKTFATMEDAPIFSVGGAGGIISRPDAFNALRAGLTATDIDRLAELAFDVFTQPDPALTLDEDKRWAANIYGKDRPHSGRMRSNLADSLVFLAVEGEALIGRRDAVWPIERLVRRIFEVDDPAIWLHARDVLPALAEAAPDSFLAAVERDLDATGEIEDRGVWRLIKPVTAQNGLDYRTGLLWALERLAWSPDRFGRVARILATLGKRPLNDNLASGPIRSLATLLHPWVPQTSAPEDLQVRVLGVLDRDFPDVAWTLALGIIDQRFGHGFYNVKPRYRREALGHGQESRRPELARRAYDVVLGRTDLSCEAVKQLAEKSPCFDGEELERLWDVVTAWGQTATDADRAAARAEIRRCAFWRLKPQPRPRGNAHWDPRARVVYDLLQPRDLIERHKWLFATGWVRFEDEDDDEDEADHRSREARVALAQAAAVQEVWKEGGLARLATFARAVGSPWALAHHAYKDLPELDVGAVTDLLLDPSLDDWPKRQEFVTGLLAQLDPVDRLALLRQRMTAWQSKGLSPAPLLLATLPDTDVWTLVDQMEEDDRETYWRNINAYVRDDPVVLNRLCRELLNVGRARAAFARGELYAAQLEPELVVDILTQLALVPGPPDEDAPVSGHDVEDLFDVLDRFPDRVGDKIVQLEFFYCRHLQDTKRGLRALSNLVADDPALIVQAVEGAYLRDDRAPEAKSDEDGEFRAWRVQHWWSILEHCRRGPATDEAGAVDPILFDAWMTKAVSELDEVGRVQNGLRVIGELVGRTRIEEDGLWPSPALAPVLECWADESFAQGLYFGIINRRTAVWATDTGGDAERLRAEKFRGWRRRVELDAPRLGTVFEQLARSCESSIAREEERAALRRAAPD